MTSHELMTGRETVDLLHLGSVLSEFGRSKIVRYQLTADIMEFQDFPPFYGMHAVDSLSGGLFSSEIGIRTVLPDSFARYMQSIPHVEA